MVGGYCEKAAQMFCPIKEESFILHFPSRFPQKNADGHEKSAIGGKAELHPREKQLLLLGFQLKKKRSSI